MVVVENIVKEFAGKKALDGISFTARPGEVLGFLGPNGAGKTTAMRIVTTFLAPTSGRVRVCGLDIAREPLAARSKIGYLPESVPLYPEMRVAEYLRYRARLKDVPTRQCARRVEEAAAQVGIAGELSRIVGQLSKGYRQRVGLADALLHRPEVLILDEPTDGLDPNQRREVLELIAALGRERTVILSTHILPEVEAVCKNVVILAEGKVIASGTPSDLSRTGKQLRVVARGDEQKIVSALSAVKGVTNVASTSTGTIASTSSGASAANTSTDERTFILTVEGDVRESVARAVLAVGELRELRAGDARFDEVFAQLTAAK